MGGRCLCWYFISHSDLFTTNGCLADPWICCRGEGACNRMLCPPKLASKISGMFLSPNFRQLSLNMLAVVLLLLCSLQGTSFSIGTVLPPLLNFFLSFIVIHILIGLTPSWSSLCLVDFLSFSWYQLHPSFFLFILQFYDINKKSWCNLDQMLTYDSNKIHKGYLLYSCMLLHAQCEFWLVTWSHTFDQNSTGVHTCWMCTSSMFPSHVCKKVMLRKAFFFPH